jgi:hypothetical protein
MIGAGSIITENTHSFCFVVWQSFDTQRLCAKEGEVISLSLKDKAGNAYVLVNNEPLIHDKIS